jgi:hypothetical protein
MLDSGAARGYFSCRQHWLVLHVKTDEIVSTLRELALKYPETEEGIACAGTALEKRTIKVRNKAFLFLGKADVMLKLRDSLTEAAKLAAKAPDVYKAGANGWVTVKLDAGASPSLDVLARWIDESYRLLAPKQLTAVLPATGLPTRKPKRPTTSKPSKGKARK